MDDVCVAVADFDKDTHTYTTKESYVIPFDHVEMYDQVLGLNDMVYHELDGEELSETKNILTNLVNKLEDENVRKTAQKLLDLCNTYPDYVWNID